MDEWRNVRPLKTKRLISYVEGLLDYKFTQSFVNFVGKYNGARPPVNVFTTSSMAERLIKSFLSFNPGDVENIVELNKSVSKISSKLVAFATDDFGNYICFDRENHSVLFLDFETGKTDLITKTFSDFLLKIEGGSSVAKESFTEQTDGELLESIEDVETLGDSVSGLEKIHDHLSASNEPLSQTESAMVEIAAEAHFLALGLAKTTGVALEAFGATEYRQAALEGLGETIKKTAAATWKFIQDLLDKFISFLKGKSEEPQSSPSEISEEVRKKQAEIKANANGRKLMVGAKIKNYVEQQQILFNFLSLSNEFERDVSRAKSGQAVTPSFIWDAKYDVVSGSQGEDIAISAEEYSKLLENSERLRDKIHNSPTFKSLTAIMSAASDLKREISRKAKQEPDRAYLQRIKQMALDYSKAIRIILDAHGKTRFFISKNVVYA